MKRFLVDYPERADVKIAVEGLEEAIRQECLENPMQGG